MRSHHCAPPTSRRSMIRSPLSGLFTAACLGLLPTFAWSQELLPCQPETQVRIVATTNDTVTLASSLQCSNGSFAVQWLGDVSVSQPIYITQGTSLNITGAPTGATADGNHATQLFVVHGASSLHLTDMILANGYAKLGGAIFAYDEARVSFGGNMRFASNQATSGGAVYADSSSTVFWGGGETIFRSNYASSHGGAILAAGSSDVSWNGVTSFINNSALSGGGAIHVHQFSKASWSSTTAFVQNSAWAGGAIYADSSTVVWNGDDTAFSNRYALYNGVGTPLADGSSDVSWDGMTVFTNNSAGGCGGAVFANESSSISWSSKTTFAENAAEKGGAIYANSSSVAWNAEDTTFGNNYASGEGSAIMVSRSSSTSWRGQTCFINNTSLGRGGAVKVADHSNGSWEGTTHFISNTAHEGGAIMATASSIISWEGETVFDSNSVSHTGGAVLVNFASKVCWTGNTTFHNNFADAGAGLVLYYNSVGVWNGTTNLIGNTAIDGGGAMNIYAGCNVSWTGVTTFTGNTATRAGAVFVYESEIFMDGNTTFSNNTAYLDGGAVIVNFGSKMFGRGTTTFHSNTAAAGDGGALGIYGYFSDKGSYADISGETTFANNSAFAHGGAIFSTANFQGNYFEELVFRSNRAGIGGAVTTFGTGNADNLVASPSVFLRCQFLHNTAAETGGAMETSFGETNMVSSYFESNSADVGGALRLGGIVSVSECSFISNTASSSGLAISAVGVVEMNGSFFYDNDFSCEEGGFLQHLPQNSSTARYDRVCAGCPKWGECVNCTVRDSNLQPTCSNALDHTSAKESGITLETLSVDGGYWRATTDSTTILACYNMAACLGGQTGAETFCDDGYTGPYCSVCKNGYSPSLSHTCTRCSTSRRRWSLAMAVITLVVAVFAMAAFSARLVSTNFGDQRSTNVFHITLRGVPLQAFKSVVVVWQILTQFASVANVTYPGIYQAFLSGVNIINIDLGFVLSAGCLWSDIDFHDRLLAGTIWPLVVLGLLAVTYAIALRRNSESGDLVREKIRNKHLSAVLLLLFLVYSSVSSTVFSMFACDSLDDGEEYLRADYRILCTDAKHKTIQVYAAIMIAVYPVGIPLLFAVLLYRHRDVLSDPAADNATARSIDSLWAPYRPNRSYYEIIECGRRIMLTGVVVFIFPNDTAQIAITIITSFFFFAVSEVLSPYKNASDEWLSRSGHVLIFFSMFNVLLLRVDVSQESSESQQVLAGVFVAGHVAMIAAVVAEAIGLCYASRNARTT